MLRLGITGTDTGVGKTFTARALLALLAEQGRRAGVMKPVETGVMRGDPGADHMLLAAACAEAGDINDVCPYVFAAPLAPYAAARIAGVTIDIGVLDSAFARVCAGRDCVLVEGAGGLLVPITRELRYDGLFARWNLEVVIVAADRLGALNHTLMTVECSRRAGLTVRAVVLNALEPNNGHARLDNASVLRELLPGTLVVEFPYGVDGGARHLAPILNGS
jgi:dethiobiotin synthetase